MRFMTGFAYAGVYIVAESWLNDRATNESRGQLLSVYMLVMFSGLALGQLLLNVADPAGFFLFLLTSVMISLAMVPIALTAGPAPAFEATDSVAEISLLMGITVVGGIVAQWPIGHLSDRFDRRRIITAVALLAAIFALLAAVLGGTSLALLLTFAFLLGCMTLPMYSLCIAHTNDYLEPNQMVEAGATLVLVGGIGACIGPPVTATLMGAVGPIVFFVFLAGVHAAIGLFAVYRMSQRASVPLDQQGPTIPAGTGAGAGTSQLSAETMRNLRDQDLAAMSRSGLRRG
jgi:MFS family permease